MHNPLVTIATFTDSPTAFVAKQQLEAEGVMAFLVDEAITSIAWDLYIAVGWIKLKVRQSDMDSAIDILTATNLDFQPEDNSLVENTSQPSLSFEGDDDNCELLSKADKTLERAFRASVISLIFFPLQLYSLWLLAVLLFSGWKISPTRLFKALVTILLNIINIVIICAIFSAFI